jgi:pimeloyl-ACP methyl ester carboxylesterase
MELDGQPVHVHEAEPLGEVPVLYLHGVPTSGGDWAPFLARTGGLAPDLPGFGQSAKRGDHAYDPEFFADRLDAFLAARGITGPVRLVGHDWGVGWGLTWAQRDPERVAGLVLLCGAPYLPGYGWHWIARLWRRRVVGELLVGATNRTTLGLLSRQATARRGPLPAEDLARMARDFDEGTGRAILRLYRWADPDRLVAAGERLGELRAPALVVYGAQDPYLPTAFAQAYADALGGPAEAEVLEGAGHWAWVDRPELVERVAQFLLRP